MKLLTVTPPPPPPAAAVVMCLLIMLLWLDFAQLSTARRTNVLLLLADDLGI
jgi:divalent metal cation (Fe/Co/Zn/Cd) transporter